MMVIGIEGQRLFRKKKHGMDFVALELIRNLQEIDKENKYYIFVKPDVDRCLESTDNFQIVELDTKLGYPHWEQVLLPGAAKKTGCDLLHCTSNTAPVFCSTPLVITLHDIIYLENLNLLKGSGTAYQRFGNLYRRLVVPKVVKHAKKVITVSEFERKRIISHFGKYEDKLVAIYNGVSEHFREINDKKFLEAVREKYALPDRFFFFLGNTDPKKNTEGVLKAYSYFLQNTPAKIHLVMPDLDHEFFNRIVHDIGNDELFDMVKLTGYIDNTELPAFYNLCELFLYTSLRESFGIPMLEAMKCGTPVITSNTSSMPEVSGDAAVITDPYNPLNIADAMIRIINNDTLKNELREKGLNRAATFSWKHMAEEVLELYQSL